MRQAFTYLVVGVISLAAAVYVSSIWLAPAKSALHRSPAAQANAKIKVIAQVNLPIPETVPGASPAPPTQEGQGPAALTVTNTVVSMDPAQAFLEPYLYDTREGRRNPFKPAPLIESGAFSNQMVGPATPLERFELDELKLLAIIWDVKSPRAMFMDPTSEVHTVTKDDRIGRRRGYIAVIREGEVVVVESTTYGGEPVYSTRILRMDR